MTWPPDFSDDDVRLLVDNVCHIYGTNAFVSPEADVFFQHLLDQYQGQQDDYESLKKWLHKKIPEVFVALGERPKWIQDARWPFFEGEPMIFVGQIDISVQGDNPALKMFHDDTSFYVFINRTGVRVTEVIIQQY